ncbi:MAG: ferredoxin:thioredoxin reductase [Methanocalculaceae archaeon]|jgi:ferredoxin-thioredoxin reductase catalytic subunit|nr:ferredoxin:thioredoxin reductase [Methanocalculaceae archaeon]
MTTRPSPEEIAALIPKIRADSEKLAQRKGWMLNPNTPIADSVIEGLARNKLMRGKRYCPCRLPSGNPDVDKLFICPCRDAEKDVKTDGHCHCYFFYMK